MLVDFSVKNFKSFDEQQVLSLLKENGSEHSENSFTVGAKKNLELLKSAAVYGANASGKSNLIQAIDTMKSIVLYSSQTVEDLNVIPFKLFRKNLNEPTELEVTIVVNDTKYQYGFSATKNKIFEEWLFAYPNGHAQKWFERIWDQKNNKYEWSFSPSFTGQKQVWLRATRDNALFLSTAVQLNSEKLKPIYDWFKDELYVFSGNNFFLQYTADLCNEGNKDTVLKFLKAADLGISDISVEEKETDEKSIPDSIPEAVKNFFIEVMPKKKKEITSYHKDNDGNSVEFNFSDESTGTIRFFGLVCPLIDILEKGATLIIDDLNCNLHPKMVEFIVKLFNSKKCNPNNAQLIFSTHDVYILSQRLFRRDQIWFCEKNKKQATEVYSLLEFSPNKDKDNIALRYLSGRYGALPLITDFDLFEGAE